MNHQQELDSIFQGFHNANLEASRARLVRGETYQNLSTVWVTPIPEDPPMVPAKVVFQSWLNLMMPMNQLVFRLPMVGMEVGDAYNQAVDIILAHPQLSRARYMLTVEWDNLPPPDGLLKLYESIKGYGAISGLYFTKGELGQPMIYGDPKVMPRNFIPQLPIPDTIQPCNGIGMGFALFRLSMFKDKDLQKPWFKTLQSTNGSATQDLYFCQNAAKCGYKFAVDTRVKVGHLDVTSGFVW